MKSTVLFLLLGLMSGAVANAQAPKGVGVGIIIGDSAGLSLKKWVSDTKAFDAGVSWSFSGNDTIRLHADYLIHNFSVYPPSNEYPGRFPIYFGIGGKVQFKEDGENLEDDEENDDEFGIRFPIGLNYLLASAPADLFVEVVPGVIVSPKTDFEMDFAVGARFFF